METHTDTLLFFYGADCEHCKDMEGLVARLVAEGVPIVHKEVYNDKDNESLLVSLDTEPCGGVPFFYNTKTKHSICGEASYKELKEWAKGE